MNCILQRSWHSCVRQENDRLLVESVYCGSDREACARMRVDPYSFAVLEAWWESYRTPREKNYKLINVTESLNGTEAYFGCGPALRDALKPLQDPYAVDLFAEGVRGIIQAETFLYKKRGFSSSDEYDNYWEEMFLNSCRYYSNLERVQVKWFEHVGYTEREGNLYNKMKSQTVFDSGDKYVIIGELNDSFHGVAVDLEVSKESGRITKAAGDILRAPDEVCSESVVFLQEVEEKNLHGFKKKEIAEILGKGEGCVHLIDIVSDASGTLELLQGG